MEQVAFPETIAHRAPDRTRPLVFLDSNVIMAYLRGEQSATRLFSAEAEGSISFALNPIVLQELLLASEPAGISAFDRIQDHFEVLPLSLERAEALLPRARMLLNRFAHPNEILILSSAADCDFLVTREESLKALATGGKPHVVTPEELLALLGA